MNKADAVRKFGQEVVDVARNMYETCDGKILFEADCHSGYDVSLESGTPNLVLDYLHRAEVRLQKKVPVVTSKAFPNKRQLTITVSVLELLAIMNDVARRAAYDSSFKPLYNQLVKTLEDAVESNGRPFEPTKSVGGPYDPVVQKSATYVAGQGAKFHPLHSGCAGTLTLKSIPTDKYDEVIKTMHRGGIEPLPTTDKMFGTKQFMSPYEARNFCCRVSDRQQILNNVEYWTGVNLSRQLNLLGCDSSFERTV